MMKTRKWRGLHSNVDLTNQKNFVFIFSQEKKNERKTIKMLFPLDQEHLILPLTVSLKLNEWKKN